MNYQIFVNGKIVAQAVPLKYIAIFIKAILEEFYDVEVVVKEMPQVIDEDEIWEQDIVKR